MLYGKYTLSVFRALMQLCTWFSWQYNSACSIITTLFLLAKGPDKKEICASNNACHDGGQRADVH
jgi:hypothetical protein